METIQDIPVLFFPFSRPQYARQVFDAIKKAKPKRFYFYCDKARKGNDDELESNNTIREYIKEVDWDCDLRTWFRDINVGPYTSILNAIDWFFSNEEMGIILEEDCLPSIAFFDFCRQLLPKYRDDQRVWYLGGNNLIEDKYDSGLDYYFTPFAYQWGWATWSDRWKKIERKGFDIKKIKNYSLYNQLYANNKAANNASIWLRKVSKNGYVFKPDSWDYIFNLSMRCNGGFGIAPKINLVANIGVVGVNSNLENKTYHNLKISDSNKYLIIKEPPFVVSDFNYNQVFIKKILLKNSSFISKMRKYINRIKLFL